MNFSRGEAVDDLRLLFKVGVVPRPRVVCRGRIIRVVRIVSSERRDCGEVAHVAERDALAGQQATHEWPSMASDARLGSGLARSGHCCAVDTRWHRGGRAHTCALLVTLGARLKRTSFSSHLTHFLVPPGSVTKPSAPYGMTNAGT